MVLAFKKNFHNFVTGLIVLGQKCSNRLTVRNRLETYFEFARLGTNWRTEILAGCTTFLTMGYIVFVNPAILRDAGMPFDGVLTATCLCAALGCFLMGAVARYPLALAPGMGLNAYFTYTVVQSMGLHWRVALGAVFLSGVAFFLLTLFGIRRLILTAIPPQLYGAVASGIGIFIAFIGLRSAGLITANPATLVSLGDLRQPAPLVALFGTLVIAALLARGVPGAMLIGILASTVVAALTGLVHWQPAPYAWKGMSSTFFQLDIAGALAPRIIEVTFVFLFVALFDNIGTLVGVGRRAKLFDDSERIPRVNSILYADSLATVAGSLAGTSTVVSYVESAAGVAAGGRSGVTAMVTGLLFLVALLFTPLAGLVPAAATAPALIIVGSLMASHAAEIRWDDPAIALPAFLTLIMIPLTFSIANGLAFGFTAHTLIRLFRGEFRQVNWLMYALTGLFLFRFIFLGRA